MVVTCGIPASVYCYMLMIFYFWLPRSSVSSFYSCFWTCVKRRVCALSSRRPLLWSAVNRGGLRRFWTRCRRCTKVHLWNFNTILQARKSLKFDLKLWPQSPCFVLVSKRNSTSKPYFVWIPREHLYTLWRGVSQCLGRICVSKRTEADVSAVIGQRPPPPSAPIHKI